jgi:hypothetical protein
MIVVFYYGGSNSVSNTVTQITEDIVLECIPILGGETHEIVEELSKRFPAMRKSSIKKQALKHLKNLEGKKVYRNERYVERKGKIRSYKQIAKVWVKIGASTEERIPCKVTSGQEQVFHPIEVKSPLIHLKFRDVYEFNLPNFETLCEYSKNIPIEIINHSGTLCRIYGVKILRKKGIFGLTEKIKESARDFILGEKHYSDEYETLAINETLPQPVEPGRSLILHVPTNSELDINWKWRGDNVAIAVISSYGEFHSETFSSANFGIWNLACRYEYRKYLAIAFLNLYVVEKWDPKELRERFKQFLARFGLGFPILERFGLESWGEVGNLLAITEAKKESLGLPEELVNAIRAENERVSSCAKDFGLRMFHAIFAKLNLKMRESLRCAHSTRD